MTVPPSTPPRPNIVSSQVDLRSALTAVSDAGFVLRNVRLHQAVAVPDFEPDATDGFFVADVVVAGGRIEAIAPAGSIARATGPVDIETGCRVLIPNFVDCHTHIDKGHVLERAAPSDGTFAGAAAAMRADRSAHWTPDDVARRMDFALRCAFHHGTRALRTHIDSHPPQDAISWPVLTRIREEWRGRIDIQGSSLFPLPMVRDPEFLDRIIGRVKAAGGVLGAGVYPDPDLDGLLDTIIGAANRHGLDLDFHADETADPSSDCLRHIAEAVIRSDHEGHVLVGHCCSLALQDAAVADETLEKTAAAGLTIVVLPACNLYLQDRRTDATTPRWRGVTLLHEMHDRGIPVCLASDNTRDAFHAYGDLDMLDAFRLGTRVGQLDHPAADWVVSVTANPARAMRLEDKGVLRAGSGADFILFEGRSWSEILSRSESDRIVVRDGAPVTAPLPSYSELDGPADA